MRDRLIFAGYQPGYIYISTYLFILKKIPITGFGILTNIIKKFKSKKTEQRTIGSFMRTVSLLRFFLKQLESLGSLLVPS
jgi:hypothetical protein